MITVPPGPALTVLLIAIVRAVTRGQVGREPAAAPPGPSPQDAVAPGLAYPPLPGGGHGRRGRAAWGYALSALAVVVVAALAAAAYALPAKTTPAAARWTSGVPRGKPLFASIKGSNQ